MADFGVAIAFNITAHCPLRDVGLDGPHTRGRAETPMNRDEAVSQRGGASRMLKR